MAAVDIFPQSSELAGSSAPLRSAVAVTPSDSVELDFVTRAISFGAAGNALLVFVDSPTPVSVAVLSGVVYPFRVRQVRTTSPAGCIAYW